MNAMQAWIRRGLKRFAHRESRSYVEKVAFYAAKVASGLYRFRLRHALAVLLGRLRHEKVILHLTLQVCSPCQNDCEHCAHGAMIGVDLGYQLSLHDLRAFIAHTRASRYYVENLWITGPGEPTLWRHFDEGIRLLHDSGVIGRICVTSNGQSLDRVDHGTWRFVSRLAISVYASGEYARQAPHLEAARRAGCEVEERVRDNFRALPTGGAPDALPAVCTCPGPMVYGDRVYYHCGPTGFEAARLKGEPFLDNPRHGRRIGPDYLAGVDTRVLYGVDGDTISRATLDLCRYCWANMRIPLPWVPHTQVRRRAPSDVQA